MRGLTVVMVVAVTSCGNGFVTEDNFDTQSDAEEEAIERIQYWVGVARTLLADPDIAEKHKVELRSRIEAVRAALSRYDELRDQGAPRAAIIAPIRVAAAGIAADDVTGAGVADDVLLLPLAVAAMVTYAVTDAQASRHELAQAWNQTLTRMDALGKAVAQILPFARPGKVADTGIVEEMHTLIAANGWNSGNQGDRCRALQMLLDAARRDEDKARQARIRATQKYYGCRGSRHNRE